MSFHSFNSLFSLLIELGLQIKLSALASFLVTVPRYSGEISPSPKEAGLCTSRILSATFNVIKKLCAKRQAKIRVQLSNEMKAE